MEEQARLLQAMEQSSGQPGAREPKALFQPRGQASQTGGGRRPNQGKKKQQPAGPQRSPVPREVFETPQCATSGGLPAGTLPLGTPEVSQLQPRLIDDLHGRLDEAFLLSEVLGPPRCVRGWNDE
jgi:hypothetical protein